MKSPHANAALEAAFRTAHFRVECTGQFITFRIGQIDAAADAMLHATGCRAYWAILTACNPRARPLADAENAQRLAALQQQLDTQQLRHLPSINRAADGSWPEPGFCVLDADPASIGKLAHRFEQLAYVSARLGEAPALIWTA